MDNKDFSNTVVIGIMSELPEHKIAWILQSNLNITFTLDTDLNELSVYNSEWQGYKLYLIANRANNKMFFPKLKEFNYFLKIDDKVEAHFIQENLKHVREIVYIMIIDNSLIPIKYRKIFERIK